MEFIFIFLAIIVVAYLILHKTNHKIKQTSQKKHEIIQEYKEALQIALEKTSNNEQKIQIKNQFLQKCNSELSRNIFFTQEETKKALQELASL